MGCRSSSLGRSGRDRSIGPAPASAKSREWFRFQAAAAEPDAVDIYVFDMIGGWIDDMFGWGDVTTAKTFLDALSALPDAVKTIRVHVNSPGGDVFSAVAIANMLRAERTEKGRRVETSIEGLAASAATIVTSAGAPIRIADNALMMIHNPWSVGIGEASEMRKVAEELDKVRDQIIATYRWVSSLDEDEIGALMDATTWMDATEAMDRGFATEIVEAAKAAASVNPRALAKLGDIPAPYQAKLEEFLMKNDDKPRAAEEEEEEREEMPGDEEETEETEEVEDAEEEEDEEEAPEEKEEPASKGKANLRLVAKNEVRGEVKKLRAAVRDMCAVARRPDLEAPLFDAALDGNLSVKAAREKLFDLMADSPEITNTTAPMPGASEIKPIIDAMVRGSKRA